MIETLGFVASVEAADAAVKAANVTVATQQNVEAGYISIYLMGGLADVQAATEAGAEAARRVGRLLTVKIIPAPAEGVAETLLGIPALESDV